jgi:hypothetical protein
MTWRWQTTIFGCMYWRCMGYLSLYRGCKGCREVDGNGVVIGDTLERARHVEFL